MERKISYACGPRRTKTADKRHRKKDRHKEKNYTYECLHCFKCFSRSGFYKHKCEENLQQQNSATSGHINKDDPNLLDHTDDRLLEDIAHEEEWTDADDDDDNFEVRYIG